MIERFNAAGYQVAKPLYELIEQQVLPLVGLDTDAFWSGFGALLDRLIPVNQQLLAERESLQRQIDDWHVQHPDFEQQAYRQFLEAIGYIVPEPPDFSISPQHVDPEVALIAGPQLVVPIMNARFALNAANARWGSLYDALYGTDVIEDQRGGTDYDPVRGTRVIDYGRDFLDRTVPLDGGSHHQVDRYYCEQDRLCAQIGNNLCQLARPEQWVGTIGSAGQPESILLRDHGLHIEIQIDATDPIGATDKAAVKDIVLESAVTTIMDCEDSVAAVDYADKTLVYKNWLGLMTGNLSAALNKNGQPMSRRLNPDKHYTAVNGEAATLSGRSLLLVRNVGHLMTNNAVLDSQGNETPEGLLDGVFTSLIGLIDIQRKGQYINSACGSIYIVKPKMHGPKEVEFCVDLFAGVEQLLGLAANTIKVGIMDEERRTSVNLKACIYAARERVVFINTGFLDRTGDEIHTSMQAGPMVTKDTMKDQPWIQAYEARNVAIGLQAGFIGKAQIGKGMWAMPDLMARMMAEKVAHPQAGANCAWVPSPTAATLHAIHYHQVDVAAVQRQMFSEYSLRSLDELLQLPLLADRAQLTESQIQQELDNNIQGLLGYVVRWIDQGIGCSKVPDITDIGRMEDRATLRISSQHIANWYLHGILSKQRIIDSLKTMAKVVDEQNNGDANYVRMADDDKNVAFKTAKDLIFKGKIQPSGYTEPLLQQSRLQVKNRL